MPQRTRPTGPEPTEPPPAAPNPIPAPVGSEGRRAALQRAAAMLTQQQGRSAAAAVKQAVQGSAPDGGKPQEASPDRGEAAAQQVPYSRLEEVVAERDSYREQLGQMADASKKEREELASLRQRVQEAERQERIEKRLLEDPSLKELEDADPDTRQAAIARIVAEETLAAGQRSEPDPVLREIAAERELLREAPDMDFSRAQLAALSEIKAETSLGIQECMALASVRQPSLFSQSDERGYDDARHSAPVPNGESSPNRSEPDPERELIREVADSYGMGHAQREGSIAKLIGHRMRRAWRATQGNPLYQPRE